MNHFRSKFIVAGLIMTACLSYLVFAGVQGGWVYYVDVDDFTQGTEYHDQRVRLSGIVGDEDVTVKPAQLSAVFPLLGITSQVNVVYHGIVPDLFKPGSEVVVEGKLDEHGVFQATILLTKCASKYTGDHAERMEEKL